MKILYAAGSALSLIVILVLAFENIQSSCQYLMFFFWELPTNVSPTIVIFVTALGGMVAGSLTTLFLTATLGAKSDDEESEDF